MPSPPLMLLLLAFPDLHNRPPPLPRYESRFYRIETDLPKDRAAWLGRFLDATGSEYHRRFEGFRGVVRTKPKVRIYAVREDFTRALERGSDAEVLAWHIRGLFLHSDQTVYTYDGPDIEHTLKHECFHQFAALVVGGRLPQWANEGLAEYFAEGEFDEATGRLLLGRVPAWRVLALRDAVRKSRLIPMSDLVLCAPQEWNDRIAHESGSLQYVQAWALCHFLIHANERKYRPFFDQFLRHLDHGLDPASAFTRAFGADLAPLQVRYDEYLKSLECRGPITE